MVIFIRKEPLDAFPYGSIEALFSEHASEIKIKKSTFYKDRAKFLAERRYEDVNCIIIKKPLLRSKRINS